MGQLEYEEKMRKFAREHVAIFMARRAAIRATKKGLPFNITDADIHIPPVCPVLGMELKSTGREGWQGSPSLDRIVPALGYVKGNVRVISWRANRLRSDAKWDELLEVALDSVMMAHGEEKARACAKAIAAVLGLTSSP